MSSVTLQIYSMAIAVKITPTTSYSCLCCVRCMTSVFMMFTSSSARLSCLSARCSSFTCCSASFSSLSSLCVSSNSSLFNIRSTSVSDLIAGVLLLFLFPELKNLCPRYHHWSSARDSMSQASTGFKQTGWSVWKWGALVHSLRPGEADWKCPRFPKLDPLLQITFPIKGSNLAQLGQWHMPFFLRISFAHASQAQTNTVVQWISQVSQHASHKCAFLLVGKQR